MSPREVRRHSVARGDSVASGYSVASDDSGMPGDSGVSGDSGMPSKSGTSRDSKIAGVGVGSDDILTGKAAEDSISQILDDAIQGLVTMDSDGLEALLEQLQVCPDLPAASRLEHTDLLKSKRALFEKLLSATAQNLRLLRRLTEGSVVEGYGESRQPIRSRSGVDARA